MPSGKSLVVNGKISFSRLGSGGAKKLNIDVKDVSVTMKNGRCFAYAPYENSSVWRIISQSDYDALKGKTGAGRTRSRSRSRSPSRK